jgi:hypothetical protein
MSLPKQCLLHDASTLSENLRALIEESYVVFAGHSVGIPLGVCKCNVCCSDESERLLVRTPLRAMTSAVLSEYTNSAHGYDERSDGHALRYFLPRYLELIALNDPPHYGDLPHCLVRLGSAAYRQNWHQDEISIINRIFDALLIEKLADVSVLEWPIGFALRYPIDDLLEMLVLGGADLDRIFAAWNRAPDPGGAVHLASLAKELTSKNGEMVYFSHVLGDHGDACRAIGTFICRREQVERLEHAFFILEDRPDLQRILSDAQSFIASVLPHGA